MQGSARIAVLLFAMVATASCTSEGLAPPVDVGTGATAVETSPYPAATAPVAPTTEDSPPASVAAIDPATTMPQGDGGPIAAVLTPSRIQFAPIVGSTVQAATPLTQELAKRARERGIGIAGNGGTGATHILKGYFSAMTEGGSTTVIYVWDVLDPAGNRLHRIQGQAKADGRGDGWAAVPSATMQAIADRTIDEFAQWLSARTG
jgi:hypothetical protein